MKKIFLVFIVLVTILTLSACGNMSMGLGNYSFNRVHVDTEHYAGDLTIKKWHDSEGSGIEVDTEEVGAIFLSEGTYILLEGDCPFCKG